MAASKLLEIKKQLEVGRSIYDIPLRVCFYARVSTDKDEQISSLDNQIMYFDGFIKSKENWEFAGGYIDEGISGKSVEKRTNFLKMIKDAERGSFDLIITKEISRFSRSTLDSIKYTQELLACGVGVLFQSDNINTLLPDSELRLTIMASIAQEEVRKLSERLRFGYKRSIEKGRVLGQNNMFGYHKEDGKLTIIEDEADIVRKIFDIYIEGKIGIRRIARELEKSGIVSPNTGRMFSFATIKDIITNPKYKGFYCSGKTISIDYRQSKRIRLDDKEWNVYKDENIPAIVSEEIWDKANILYRERGEKAKNNAGAYSQRYPFSGKLLCSEHGTSYHRHIYTSKSRGDQEVWNCKLYRLKGKVDGCDSPTLYSSELQKILDEVYKTVYDGRDAVVNGLLEIYSNMGDAGYDYSKKISAKEAEIAKVNKSKDQLLDLLMEGLISKQDFKRRNDLMSESIERIDAEIKAFEAEADMQVRNKKEINKLKRTIEEVFEKSNGFSEELNRTLLDKIIVHKVGSNRHHVKLEILLNLGSSYLAEVNKGNRILLQQIGISQAQVSRLEKNALKNMKKYIS